MSDIEALVLRHEKPIYRLALRLTQDESAALCMTVRVFTESLRHLPPSDITLPHLYALALALQ